MTARKTRHLKMWVAMVLASVALILGHGFYRDLSANNEETYKGLKLFSDVIELVQKNYVDEVDTQNMIEAAIQGMVRSLDPHSTLLPPDALKELQIDTHGEFTVGVDLQFFQGVGGQQRRMGVQAADHALDGRFDHVLGVHLIHVIFLNEFDHIGKQLEALVGLFVVGGQIPVKAVAQYQRN